MKSAIKFRLGLITGMFFLFGFLYPALALPPTAHRIKGTVYDASGATLTGATITVKLNNNTEVTNITDNPAGTTGTSATSVDLPDYGLVAYYDFNLIMDDPDTQGTVEGAVQNDVIHIFINGVESSETSGGTITVVSGNSDKLDLHLPDVVGPTTSDVQANSSTNLQIQEGTTSSITLTATVSDAATGGRNIKAVEYFVGTAGSNGSGTSMSAIDGAFDSAGEGATATVDTSGWTTANAPYTLLVHGQDADNNWGATQSVQVNVYVPVAAPTFDIGTGTYNTQQNVTATLGNGAANTYYTLDGSDPDNTDTAYTLGSQIAINGNDTNVIVLKMVSYDASGNKGVTGSATYTFDKVGPVAATFDIGTGNYNTAQAVTPTPAGDAATTYYTTDGTEPDSTKTAYTTGTIAIDGADGVAVTLKMVSYDALGNKGTVATATYTFDKVGPVAATFDIGTGIYNAAQAVTPAPAGDAATTYFTTDGTEPDNTKTAYTTGTIAIDGNDGAVVMLKMVSYDALGNKGTVATANYAFDKVGPAAATFAPGTGSYNAAQTVTPTPAGDAATTYYTTDGAEPDNTKTAYTTGTTIAIDGNDGVAVTLKMVSYDALGNKGTVATATYTFDKVGPVAATFDIGTGNYNAAQAVTPTPAGDAATTYYTTNGDEPDNSKTAYTTGTIAIDGADGVAVTLKMVSYDTLGNKGSVATATYTFDKVGPVAATFDIGTGNYNAAQAVTPAPAGDAGTTYYTTDGTEPDNTKTAYTTGTIAIDGNDGAVITLKMVSYDALGNKGTVATATYTFDKVGPVAATFDIGTGNYNAAQTVTPTPAGDAATTYYTTDGTEPDNTKTAYTTGTTIAIDGNDGTVVTLKMVSYDALGNKGTVSTATYTFDKAAPTVAITSPAASSFVSSASLTIQGTVSDAAGTGVAKVQVSIDNGASWNDATISGAWSYAATLVQGANIIKVKASDNVGNVSNIITGATITYYPPLTITVDGQNVTNGEIYVPNLAGNNARTIIVTGGSTNYTNYTWTFNPAVSNGALSAGTANNEKVFTANIGAEGNENLTIQDPTDTGLYSATLTIRVVSYGMLGDVGIIKGQPSIYTIVGAIGDTTWSVTEGADVAGTPVISGDKNITATVTPSVTGTFKIKGTDGNTGAFADKTVTVYEALAITYPASAIGIAVGDTTYGITASGATGTYKFQSTDTAVATVNADGGGITPVAAGTCTIQVRDATYGDFATDNGFRAVSPQVEIVNPIVIGGKPTNDVMSSATTNPFTATGGKTDGEVDWEADAGSITAAGVFTAPTVTTGSQVVTITAYDKTYNKDHLTPVKTQYQLTVYSTLAVAPVYDMGLVVNDTTVFTASGGNAAAGTNVWSVADNTPVTGGDTVGAVVANAPTTTATFTATKPGTIKVKVTDDKGLTATSGTIQVVDPIVIGNTPANDALASAGTNDFSTTGGTGADNVTWETTAGSIDANGLFTAPTVPTGSQTVTITAYDKTYGKTHATPVMTTYTLTVFGALAVAPTNDIGLAIGGTYDFTVSGGNAAAGTNVWSTVENTPVTGGDIVGTVAANAPTTSATFTAAKKGTIKVQAADDKGLTAKSGTIEVVDPIVFGAGPGNDTLTSQGSFLFTVTGGKTGEVDWEASLGSIATTGLFTAPTVTTGTQVVTITAYDKTYNKSHFSPVKTTYTVTIYPETQISEKATGYTDGTPSTYPILRHDGSATYNAADNTRTYDWTVVDWNGTQVGTTTTATSLTVNTNDLFAASGAGVYTITLQDKTNTGTAPAVLNVRVPMKFVATKFQNETVKDAGNYNDNQGTDTYTITGGPATNVYGYAALDLNGTAVTETNCGKFADASPTDKDNVFNFTNSISSAISYRAKVTLDKEQYDTDTEVKRLVDAGLDVLYSGVFTVTPKLTYSGKIVDENGNGIGGVTITAVHNPDAIKITGGTDNGGDKTNNDGTFTLTSFDNIGVTYKFLISKPGTHIDRVITDAEIKAAATAGTGIVLKPIPVGGSTISGTITLSDNPGAWDATRGTATVQVKADGSFIKDADGNTIMVNADPATGNYTFPVPPQYTTATEFVVEAKKSGYVFGSFDSGATLEGSLAGLAPPMPVAGANLTLKPSTIITVTGTAQDAVGGDGVNDQVLVKITAKGAGLGTLAFDGTAAEIEVLDSTGTAVALDAYASNGANTWSFTHPAYETFTITVKADVADRTAKGATPGYAASVSWTYVKAKVAPAVTEKVKTNPNAGVTDTAGGITINLPTTGLNELLNQVTFMIKEETNIGDFSSTKCTASKVIEIELTNENGEDIGNTALNELWITMSFDPTVVKYDAIRDRTFVIYHASSIAQIDSGSPVPASDIDLDSIDYGTGKVKFRVYTLSAFGVGPAVATAGGGGGTTATATSVDSDSDGLTDEWEMLHFGTLSIDGTGDADGDGLTDLQEYLNGTNPNSADSDGDGISDFDEIQNGTDPNTAETTGSTGAGGSTGTATDGQATTAPASDDGGSSDCFIATAAFGSPFEAHVKTLRKFRDAYLLPVKAGRAFVKTYYRYSPPIANYIAERDSLRAMVRFGLMPFVGTSYIALNPSVMETPLVPLGIAVAMVLLTLAFSWRRNRQGRR